MTTMKYYRFCKECRRTVKDCPHIRKVAVKVDKEGKVKEGFNG